MEARAGRDRAQSLGVPEPSDRVRIEGRYPMANSSRDLQKLDPRC
jgi:hypothetical protein